MYSYNQIIKRIKWFADNHRQVNSFGNGDLWEVIEHDQLADFEYPLIFLVDVPNTINASVDSTAFDVYFMDLVHKDESNENEVKSDQKRTALDLIAFLKQDATLRENNVVITKNNTLTSFTEKFNDELTGWKMNIQLNQPFNYNSCQIPFV